jgi:hypothetical protein
VPAPEPRENHSGPGGVASAAASGSPPGPSRSYASTRLLAMASDRVERMGGDTFRMERPNLPNEKIRDKPRNLASEI